MTRHYSEGEGRREGGREGTHEDLCVALVMLRELEPWADSVSGMDDPQSRRMEEANQSSGRREEGLHRVQESGSLRSGSEEGLGVRNRTRTAPGAEVREQTDQFQFQQPGPRHREQTEGLPDHGPELLLGFLQDVLQEREDTAWKRAEVFRQLLEHSEPTQTITGDHEIQGQGSVLLPEQELQLGKPFGLRVRTLSLVRGQAPESVVPAAVPTREEFRSPTALPAVGGGCGCCPFRPLGLIVIALLPFLPSHLRLQLRRSGGDFGELLVEPGQTASDEFRLKLRVERLDIDPVALLAVSCDVRRDLLRCSAQDEAHRGKKDLRKPSHAVGVVESLQFVQTVDEQDDARDRGCRIQEIADLHDT